MKTTLAIALAFVLCASLVTSARADEPCGRGDCHGLTCATGNCPAAQPKMPAVDARPMPATNGPTVIYVAPYVPHPLAAIVHAVRGRMHQAACNAQATVQTIRTEQPVRTFIRNHRPHIRCR